MSAWNYIFQVGIQIVVGIVTYYFTSKINGPHQYERAHRPNSRSSRYDDEPHEYPRRPDDPDRRRSSSSGNEPHVQGQTPEQPLRSSSSGNELHISPGVQDQTPEPPSRFEDGVNVSPGVQDQTPEQPTRSSTSDNETCAVCLDDIGTKILLNCRHQFHQSCLTPIINRKCPLCGHPFTLEQIQL